ncbi:MAG: D-alanyl-D-alanine carboxypeptidase [Magnetospirillum sp. WYHS-4]
MGILRNHLVGLLLAGGAAFPAMAEPIDTAARHAFMMDTGTGAVLLDKDADIPMPPASMSKVMTMYMLFEALKERRVSLTDTLPVSENAWRRGGAKTEGSTMFLPLNSRVKVEDAIRGIIVQSGNDACIVVAEALAGSEDAFAEAMNKKARQIGMTNSSFRNATGWPHPEHRMTARDLAILAKRTILDFPDYYRYYAEREFTYNNVKQENRNPLIRRNMGADGLKTGHTEESGYGLMASATRNDRRLVLVVNGLKSMKQRGEEAERLLEWGFREFNNYALFKAGDVVGDAAVWLGKSAQVPLVVDRDLVLTMPRKSRLDMKVTVKFEGPIPAPVVQGAEVGKVTVTAPGVAPVEIPIRAGANVERLGLGGRLASALSHIVFGHP